MVTPLHNHRDSDSLYLDRNRTLLKKIWVFSVDVVDVVVAVAVDHVADLEHVAAGLNFVLVAVGHHQHHQHHHYYLHRRHLSDHNMVVAIDSLDLVDLAAVLVPYDFEDFDPADIPAEISRK